MIASDTLIGWYAEPCWLKCRVRKNIFAGREVLGWIVVNVLVAPNPTIVSGSREARKVIAYDTFIITDHIAR